MARPRFPTFYRAPVAELPLERFIFQLKQSGSEELPGAYAPRPQARRRETIKSVPSKARIRREQKQRP